ncbi:MAG: recombination protein RecR, partial [Patescibacteria group bacterium]|nr:recombination protein RecR [Patescibacteria group bacterium]
MGSVLPSALIDLIDCFTNFPGVGEKTAERYAYFALKQDKSLSDNLAKALQKLHRSIKICPVTFALIDTSEDVSPLYRDTKRN